MATTLGARHLLGPRDRRRTSAHLSGPLHQGRLAAVLLIVGGGNALLQAHELQAWFGRRQAQGLQEVLGGIVLDRDALQLREQDFDRTPPPAVDRPHPAWPDALTLDEGPLRVAGRRWPCGARGGATAARERQLTPLSHLACAARAVHQSELLALRVREINKTSGHFAACNLMLSLAPGLSRRAATLVDARERLAGWLSTQ